jgi:hypothetical protein
LLLQYGPVQFGLVTMNSPGLTYRQACTYYPVTCDGARVHQWLKEMRYMYTLWLFHRLSSVVKCLGEIGCKMAVVQEISCLAQV